MLKFMEKIIREYADEPLLLVTDNDAKKLILNELNDRPLMDISFLTMPELIQRLTFRYEPEAVYETMKQFKVNYDVAKTYLDNMVNLLFIDKDKVLEYETESVQTVEKVFDHLSAKQMIITDNLFLEYCRRHRIIIAGYEFIPKEYLKVLGKIRYEIIAPEDVACDEGDLRVFSCQDVEEELFVALEQISKLIVAGVSLHDIKILGINEGEHDLVQRMFDMYRIPACLNQRTALYHLELTKSMVEAFFSHRLDDFLSHLNAEEADLSNDVIGVLNRYTPYLDDADAILREVITHDLMHTYRTEDGPAEAVEVIGVSAALCQPDKHLFVIGLNQGNLPKVCKDENYFKDRLKKRSNMSLSCDYNQHYKNELCGLIRNSRHLHASFRRFDKMPMYPSHLINELKLKTVEADLNHSEYSGSYNMMLLARGLDEFEKYGIRRDGLSDLYATYPIPYRAYDHSFKGISEELLLERLHDRLSLSYSSVDCYFKCKFMYYLKYILKLDENRTTFPLFIGNLFHSVLSKAFDDGFIFEDAFSSYMKDAGYPLSAKESFLLSKLKQELLEIVQTLYEQHQLMHYKETLFEERVEVEGERLFHDRTINFKFTGIIDKLLYKVVKDESTGKDITCISIVDYKTGNLDIRIDLVDYGLSLQLPIYLYLADNCKKLTNVKVYGFFLQNILHDVIKADSEDEYRKKKADEMRLSGYIVEDVGNIAEFDPTKANSSLIKSLRIKNDGTYYATSKVLTGADMEKLKETVHQKIDEAADNILNGDYKINPKLYQSSAKREDLSCRYCQFADICYRTYRDYQLIKAVAGGEEQDEMDGSTI